MTNGRTIAEDMAREHEQEQGRLRDTFAAAALTGLMQFRLDAATPGAYVKSTAVIAADAHDIADAMLRERLRQSDSSQPVKPADATPDTHDTQSDGSVQGDCTLTVEEREAILYCVSCAQDVRDTISTTEDDGEQRVNNATLHIGIAMNLAMLRERENDHDAVPEARAAEPESSVPPGSVAAPANTHTLTAEERLAVVYFSGHYAGLYGKVMHGLAMRLGLYDLPRDTPEPLCQVLLQKN